MAVGPRTRGEQLYQLQALLTEGERDAMAESALKSKEETSEGQSLLSTGYILLFGRLCS